MHRFFAVEGKQSVFLRNEDAAHALRVLRLRKGDEVEAILRGKRWLARIVCSEDGVVRLSLLECLSNTEPRAQVHLYQGLPKLDRMELIVQKCTELGVAGVHPILMARCIARSEGQQAVRKAERLRRIAEEAVKQCGRVCVPEISPPALLTSLGGELAGLDLVLVPWEEETPNSRSVHDMVTVTRGRHEDAPLRIGIVIGPEGGIAADEIDFLRHSAHARTVSLGPRILRAETAAITATALVMASLGELG